MNETTDPTEIFAPLWKRKWLIFAVGGLVAIATYFYYSHQPKVYGASTAVYLGGESEVQPLLGEAPVASANASLERANQAALINSSVVGEAVEHRLMKNHEPTAPEGVAMAVPAEESDFISISTEAATGRAAAVLANTYAQVYIAKRESKFEQEVRAARDILRQQLRNAERDTGEQERSTTPSATLRIQGLAEELNRFNAALSIGSRAARQIDPAVASTVPLSPTPIRNAIFGFVLGIVFSSIGVYLVSRFDRRLRSLADVEAAFQTEILTALPSVKHPVVWQNGVAMPAQTLREPLRRLHTTLQLRGTIGHRQMRQPSLLFVSAAPEDGKSSLIANLALTQAEAGERAAIIEADLRRPTQANLLGADNSRGGVAEVLTGTLSPRDGMQQVGTIAPGADPASVGESGVAMGTIVETRPGSVFLLASGEPVANPPALLANRFTADLLNSIAVDFDHVLIDAPPLEVSDVMPLFKIVDGIVIIARLGHTREAAARRLHRVLSEASSAPILGTVVTDVPAGDIESYGLSTSMYYQQDRQNGHQ